MKATKLLVIVSLINLGAWSFRVMNHFFDYHLADEMGLIVSFLGPYLVGKGLRTTGQLSPGVFFLSMIGITFLLHPVLSLALQQTDYAWLIANLLFGGLGLQLSYLHFAPNKLSPLLLFGPLVWILPFEFMPDQSLYFDHLVESTSTREGKIHRVSWKGEEWIHYNGRLTASTIDAHLYYEPMVHPALSLVGKNKDVLLVGGDNGIAIREIGKYEPRSFDVIPLDGDFLQNSSGYKFPFIGEEPFVWLTNTSSLYDVILLDLPDPIDITTNQYYTVEFYELCLKHLKPEGLLVTQASSPYFHPHTHYSILKTLKSVGLQTVNYHNQVPTIGQWGWVIGTNGDHNLTSKLENCRSMVPTRWWNQEAMQMMLSFGKTEYFQKAEPAINTIKSPLFLINP